MTHFIKMVQVRNENSIKPYTQTYFLFNDHTSHTNFRITVTITNHFVNILT